MHEVSAQALYCSLIAEAVSRLSAAERFLGTYQAAGDLPQLESAVLQVRKSLETIAYAAIAPNKKEYAAFRALATNSPDFTKDYHASKIFAALSRINANFYPIALAPAVRQPDGSWHFDHRQSGHLTKKKFEAAYDRLGKHLHAHNPWAGGKNIQNLSADLPIIIEGSYALLELHVRYIQTPEFNGVWVIETARNGTPPRVFTATAQGAYVVASG